MSVWLSETDKVLHKYLDRAKKQHVRQLSIGESSLVLELRQIEKDMNVCVTEVILVKQMLQAMKIKDLFWIIQNFERISKSLIVQRKLVTATRLSLMAVKPTTEELTAIFKLKPDVKKRIEYLNAIPIPENVRLTPIQEYIELIGKKSFADVIRKKFATAKEMVDFQENTEQMQAYIDEIFETVKQAGKENEYVSRLDEYIQTAKQKQADLRAEKAAERHQEAVREGQNGMNYFREHFFRGIRTLEGDETIHLSPQAISTHMAQGHRGKFCVLSCGYVNGRLIYRYAKEDGELKNNFVGIGIYPTYDNANQAVAKLQELWPDRVFEAVAI